jgi:hypothetical protein
MRKLNWSPYHNLIRVIVINHNNENLIKYTTTTEFNMWNVNYHNTKIELWNVTMKVNTRNVNVKGVDGP